ncbi:hypothetical protein [Peribacillus sp. ACCC06369]|uniref:hypothetical protein n=1 Tax=Peribacillus sp. ACCC06369 TaxID=3055860 RepID=UPI0025A111D0|nr:hypothetical protein [Peribacillus sp. ACCC06369]MDM5358742.1 hypothetical protein [Peribacillus sp. ACCC06369]
MPLTVKEFGVGEAEFEKHLNQMAGAFEDPCTPSNPREVSVEDMKKIYIAAYNGDKINF